MDIWGRAQAQNHNVLRLGTEAHLPDHALPLVGLGTGFDWGSAKWIPDALHGDLYGGAAVFAVPRAVLFTCDFDIDIDGPGGSLAQDQYWQSDTSLRWPDGTSVNSRLFPGAVIPSAIIELGAKVSDFGFLVRAGRAFAFQVYDTGPRDKIGEGSIYLARKAGLIRPNQSDRMAANVGTEPRDIVMVIFPGSGPKHAVAPDLIALCAKQFLPMKSPILNFLTI
jgi:hypothetical protein